MKISVFGLGYVGCVSAACLAARGHQVVGVDVNTTKVDLINRGHSPIVEERIGALTADVVRDGALRATTDGQAAVRTTEISLVCVGTPSAPNGSLGTVHLTRVSEQIGAAIGERGHRHTVVFRSTMLPGTCEDLLVPILEQASGLRAGEDFGVAVNPEFLREGSSVRDFSDPPKTVVGALDPASGDAVLALRGLVYAARRADVAVPILEHVLPSNEEHVRRAFELVTDTGHRRIGLFGLAFKPGTDDLRESPLVELAERLLGKGYDLRIYDATVTLSRLTGANREYIEQRLPHLGELLSDSVEAVMAHAQVCVIGCTDRAVLAALKTAGDRMVIDLVRLPDAEQRLADPGYVGLGW